MPNEPLIRLDPGGQAPILSHNLAEPSIYYGKNFIGLEYESDAFTEKAKEAPSAEVRAPLPEVPAGSAENALVTEIEATIRSGFANARLFPNVRSRSGMVRLPGVLPAESGRRVTVSVSPALRAIDGTEVAAMMRGGRRLNVYTSLGGALKHNYVAEPVEPRPRIMLVETYRLASYLGAYGAGRVIKTFSLLPGERTKISVRTFLKTEQERKEASSILDSFTEESASDFEDSVASEQSSRESYEESFQYYAEAEAKASWGFGSAKVTAGVKGGTNAAREEFGKNVSSATSKHAQKASAKRDVQVNTSYEERETSEQETATEREIENVNLSRTLNFVFRQMNQEFITILSLTDVRVAFFNGFPETRREVTLPELDSLLEEYVRDEMRSRVRADIVAALSSILDHDGTRHDDFIEQREIDGQAYLRVRSQLSTTFRDAITGTEILVPGIIVSATKNVLRTEGVMVEALLGVGEALDGYAMRLQELEVANRESEVMLRVTRRARGELVNQLVQANELERAKVLAELDWRSGNGTNHQPFLDVNLHAVPTPPETP